MLTIEPNISVSPTKLTIFAKVLDESGKPFRRPKSNHNIPPAFRGTNGRVSRRAASRLSQRIDWLAFLTRSNQVALDRRARTTTHSLSFLTLTLPADQEHPDKVIKNQCLNHFLTVLRQKFGVKHYIWKAELQKNDNIHFHLLIDRYIHYTRIRTQWNNIVGKLGYVRRYQERMQVLTFADYCERRKVSTPSQLAQARMAYNSGLRTDWSDPNSVDVRSVRGINNIRAYMRKYLTKSLDKHNTSGESTARENAFGGSIWHCSRSLSRCKGYVTLYCNKASEFVAAVANSAGVWIGEFDWCTVFSFNPAELPKRFYDQYIAMLSAMTTPDIIGSS